MFLSFSRVLHRAISSVTSAAGMLEIKMTPATESPKPNARFYGLNLLSELDAPGECVV